MTIIKALKKIKQLTRKIQTTQDRIKRWCSYLSNEEPAYTDIRAMIQSVTDMTRQIAEIRHYIHVTNATVGIEFDGNKRTIDELLLEANVVIPTQIETLRLLRRKEKGYGTDKDVKVINQYEPKERDLTIDALLEKQNKINDFLDEINIQTKI